MKYYGLMANRTKAAETISRRLYSHRELVQITGLSRTTLWRMQRNGTFPQRRQISPGRVAWVAADIEAWLTQIRSEDSFLGSRKLASRI